MQAPWRNPTPVRLHLELRRIAWHYSDRTEALPCGCGKWTLFTPLVHRSSTSPPCVVCVVRVGSVGSASLCERAGAARTAHQVRRDCSRCRLPPPVQLSLSGDLAAPATAPVVKSAAASANSMAAVLLQKSTIAAARRAMLEVVCSTASTVAAHSQVPD